MPPPRPAGSGVYPPDDSLIADDIIDFFALSIASVIQNDTKLTTPQLQRKGVEAVGKHIAHWVRPLQFDQEQRARRYWR